MIIKRKMKNKKMIMRMELKIKKPDSLLAMQPITIMATINNKSK